MDENGRMLARDGVQIADREERALGWRMTLAAADVDGLANDMVG